MGRLATYIFLNLKADMKKSRITRWILLALVVAGLGYYGWQRFHGENQETAANDAQKAARVRCGSSVATVEKADFPVYLTGLGTVQAFNTVLVRSRVDGQIDKIAFTEGQLVKQGDLLTEIDPRPYQAALDQAKAKKEQDEANLANINLDLQRFIKLGEFATRQQLDTQRSSVSQLTAQIAADAAAIDNAQTQLDYTDIKAPISGVVGLRQVDVGNIVNASAQTGIVTITQVEPIAVIFTAPEDQLPDIKDAQGATPLKTIAITTDGKRPLAEGTLAVVNNQVDFDQRHHPPQGRFRQQGPCAVARPIGLHAASGAHDEGCDRGSGRRSPARHRRPLRLCRRPGQQGRAAQGQGQPVDRRSLGDRAAACRPVNKSLSPASSRFSPAHSSAPPWPVRIRQPKVQQE